MVVDFGFGVAFSAAAQVAEKVLGLDACEPGRGHVEMTFEVKAVDYVLRTRQQLERCAEGDCTRHHGLPRVYDHVEEIFDTAVLNVDSKGDVLAFMGRDADYLPARHNRRFQEVRGDW